MFTTPACQSRASARDSEGARRHPTRVDETDGQTLKAELQRLTAGGACEARTENDLLVVFRPSAGHDFRLGDVLTFDELVLDADVSVTNLTHGGQCLVHIAAKDMHDLRLAASHGSTRTPSSARREA